MTRGKVIALCSLCLVTGMLITWTVGYSMFLVGKVVRDADIVAFKLGLEEKVPQNFGGFRFLPDTHSRDVLVIKPKKKRVKIATIEKSAPTETAR